MEEGDEHSNLDTSKDNNNNNYARRMHQRKRSWTVYGSDAVAAAARAAPWQTHVYESTSRETKEDLPPAEMTSAVLAPEDDYILIDV
ncbi:hypothetical protein SPI_06332 [Niveomyces insectorum RCEF 264]|uniref:Uncharacterized protein n=1 Tax=Niveomyces insectorum RCEF 264 TaxID=1081102 RepID=A0A167S144_9HYPO|nr:hypothetical protein SPI_06332 [Niveomyces insectorum RCEF 264]